MREINKFELLYSHSREAYQEEELRADQADQKAATLLTVLTAVIAGASFFSTRVLECFIPPKTLSEWLLLVIAGFLFLALGAAWISLFGALKLGLRRKTTINDQLINAFHKYDHKTLLHALAVRTKEARNENIAPTNKKMKRLLLGYKLTLLSLTLMIALTIVFVTQTWITNSRKTEVRPEINMNDDPKKETQDDELEISPEVPDDIQPYNIIQAANSKDAD